MKMTSNQKVVQAYMDRHGVGKLFEEMMSSLIKEMPNEPLSFLMKILQKRLKKKSSNSPLSPPVSRGMGLTGSSIPKKLSSDPQVILPGSKAVTSTYGKFDTDSLRSEDNLRSSKDRNYEKPWQVNTKSNKGSRSKKESHDEVLDGETKVHGVEEIFEQNATLLKNSSPLTRSLPLPSSKKDTSWKDSSPNKEKKVIQSRNQTTPNKVSTSITDEELMLDARAEKTPENMRKLKLSPYEYSRVKRHSSKKKAVIQKRKLQALLSNDDAPKNKQENSDSSDDEAVDIIESAHDLQCEGVSSTSSGYKHVPQRQQQNQHLVNPKVTVGVCSRCARVIDEKETLQSSLRRVDSYSDGEIESVSQINSSKPFRPKWPVLSDSDGESLVEEKIRPKTVERVKFRASEEKPKKSDFFDVNSPLRKKTKQVVTSASSDSESARTFTTSKNENKTSRGDRSKMTSSPKKSSDRQAWKQQIVDSNSDEEVLVKSNATFSKGVLRSSGGFNLKDAGNDDDSDFL